MTTIITGATGQLGRWVTDELLDHLDPAELILTTRNPQALTALAARGASVRYADFDKPETLEKAFEGGDNMLLISTLSVGRRGKQHRRAIDAAVKAGVRHIAYTSSGGARPDNPAMVIADHLETEEALKQCGVPWTILRNSLYAEVPVLNISLRALELGKWIGSAGDGRIAFVAKADCVACAVHVLTSKGHAGVTYEITGPELLSYRDAAAITSEISGKPIEYVVVSDEEMLEGLIAAGVPRRYEEGMQSVVGTSSAEDIVSYERGIRGNYFAVISDHVRQLLGRQPIPLRQLYEAHADRFR